MTHDGGLPATLFHYTDEEGLAGILGSNELRASTALSSSSDVRYGPGQYLSDVEPGTKTPAQLSRLFLGHPFRGSQFSHYIEIDVSRLELVRGRPGVWLVPNDRALDLTDRIVRSGPSSTAGR